uniref:WHEP-TRS domain-containing protein n=1 Tax=Arion vulgaris TaxID=1028688 RepID=A0A0B7B301_9EUPU
MQINKPWVLAKGSPEERKRAGAVVSLCANVSCLLSVLLQPYMPSTSAVIQQQLQAAPSVNVLTSDFLALLQTGHQIGTPSPLFQKIENSTITDLKLKFAGKPQEKVLPKGNKLKDQKSSKESVATQQQNSVTNNKDKLGTDSANVIKDVLVNGTLEHDKGNAADVAELSQAVTDQGLKVRELKAAKGDKSVIDAEVATLLQLKQKLALAQGQTPDAAVKGNKRGKKK